MNKVIRLASIGLGGRGSRYLQHAAKLPDLYQVVAGADPRPEAVSRFRELIPDLNFRIFKTDAELLAEPKLADVLIIATQDSQHREHAIAAMEKGYDLLLEKPIASNIADVMAVHEAAARLGRRVLVCHVLRYTAIYSAIKQILDSGRIGDIISLNATEGVGAWHQSHSYVRGHWSKTEDSSPMIIAKSCHDLDIIYWLVGRDAVSVSSYGGLDYFTSKNAPTGAPKRCADGCPINGTCFFDAHHYGDTQRKWLYMNPELERPETTREQILDWILPSPWGRCVYHCDNTAVDHQVVNINFCGGVTATFTMTAFAIGRTIEIFGTKGVIRAGAFYKESTGSEILIQDLDGTDKMERIDATSSKDREDSHSGGDEGLVRALYDEMHLPSADDMKSSLKTSIISHLMGYAAEEARITGKSVNLDDFTRRAQAAVTH